MPDRRAFTLDDMLTNLNNRLSIGRSNNSHPAAAAIVLAVSLICRSSES
jgi:hypothetical protein